MCNNIIVLYIFIILKVVAVLVLPIIILIKRKKEYVKILVIVDIILLFFFFICNSFNINKCVYNSSIDGIKRVNNENIFDLFFTLHPKEDRYNSNNINPEKNYKTYTGKNLYYYNQNRNYMKNAYYECNNNKVYINSFGSSITTFSMAISTIFDKNINPVEIFDYYKEDTSDICSSEITLDKIYNSVMQRYGGILLERITPYQINDEIKKGNLVIVKLSASQNSKLTCDSSYVLIYSIDNDDKYLIADPTLNRNSYVCPSTSRAYGSVIDKENMNKSWTLQEIGQDAQEYYLVKKVS